MKKLIVLSALVALAAQGTFAEAVPGQDAPAASFVCTGGKSHSVADFKGKYVVFEWTNPGCPFVRKHYGSGNMQKLQKELTGQGVVWLTVNSAAAGKAGHMTAAKWDVLAKEQGAAASARVVDESGEVGRAFGAKTTPHMFVVGPDGKVLYTGALDDKPTTDAADLASAVNHVKQAIEESKAGRTVSNPRTPPYGCGVKY